MKRILIILLALSGTTLIFSQTIKPSGKIIFATGQKLTVQSNTGEITTDISTGLVKKKTTQVQYDRKLSIDGAGNADKCQSYFTNTYK